MAAGREPFNMTPKAPSPTIEAAAGQQQHSPWHSPVPYLFGGLAAMLGLIAFALLILACSYWKLSGYLDGDRDNEDLEAGEGGNRSGEGQKQAFEEKILVIMAGEDKPTFLATPMSSRSSSFGDGSSTKSCSCSSNSASEKGEKLETCVEMVKQETSVGDEAQVQSGSLDTRGRQRSSTDHQQTE